MPQVNIEYGGKNNGSIRSNIERINGTIAEWQSPNSHKFEISRIVETSSIQHDGNDDGLHFLSTGYHSMAKTIFNALEEGLKLCDSAKQ